jgi:superfamily I DNA/RNA helicase
LGKKAGGYIVEAVPGSGKTQLVVAVSKTLPGTKIIVTLQKRCVGELNERLSNSGSTDTATTIHSFGNELIGLVWRSLCFARKPIAWDNNETKNAFIAFTERLTAQEVEPEELWRVYQKWCAWGGSFKKNAEHAGVKWKARYEAQIKTAFSEWAEYKRKQNRVDFYDMVRLPLKVLHEKSVHRYVAKHTALIVDELQDCSLTQLKLIVELMTLAPTSVLVCDRLQSIYKFSGGVGNPFRFVRKEVLTRTLRLEYSLRLTREVADFIELVMEEHYADLSIKTVKVGLQPKNANLR